VATRRARSCTSCSWAALMSDRYSEAVGDGDGGSRHCTRPKAWTRVRHLPNAPPQCAVVAHGARDTTPPSWPWRACTRATRSRQRWSEATWRARGDAPASGFLADRLAQRVLVECDIGNEPLEGNTFLLEPPQVRCSFTQNWPNDVFEAYIVASLTPSCWYASATAAPFFGGRRANAICSSLTLDWLTAPADTLARCTPSVSNDAPVSICQCSPGAETSRAVKSSCTWCA
jgi:hypothetical protein